MGSKSLLGGNVFFFLCAYLFCAQATINSCVLAIETKNELPVTRRSDPSALKVVLSQKADGYRGIWYANQPQGDEYVYKYSGGLGTYCAKHRPFAIYVPAAHKTFFCYGGTDTEGKTLLHMVSYYDHATGLVPRPTIVLDKHTADAHDNPVISIDRQGYIWVFSSSHGTARPSYVCVSTAPYSIESFRLIHVTNFSYPQVHYNTEHGFLFVHTLYEKNHRRLFFATSVDGYSWEKAKLLAYIDEGHYAISELHGNKLAVAFNYHPKGRGLNWRTNLYYIETTDGGKSWHTADGKSLQLPLTTPSNPALVCDYRADGWNVYLKDIAFDGNGQPVILFLTSRGWKSGPESNPHIWRVAQWTGKQWRISSVFQSDNNYDMGSLYIENDCWRIIAPALPGPQRFNTGGEVGMWISYDEGRSWKLTRQLTRNSIWNHTYCRRPVNAHPDFYALWADGNARSKSPSRLYFCNQQGHVFMLPPHMPREFARPIPVNIASSASHDGTDGDHLQQTTAEPESANGTSEENSTPIVDSTPKAKTTKFPWQDLPLRYREKIDLLPDLCQTAPIFRSLPYQGRSMCGPTSVADVLIAIDRAEFDNLIEGDVNDPLVQKRLLEELTGTEYMPLSPRGIGPYRVLAGLDRFLKDRGFEAKLEWRGWRYGGRYAVHEPLTKEWLCRGVLGTSHVVLNLGWYKKRQEDTYERIGGHYVVLAGFEQKNNDVVFLVHDPSSRSGPGKVTHEVQLTPIGKTKIVAKEAKRPLDATGWFRVTGLPISRSADMALLDGAIRIQVLGQTVQAASN